MFKSYLNTTFRLMRKNKMYSFINIFGFATGMAACLIILLWVVDELSYNHFHKNLQRIYLVAQTQHYKTRGDFTVSPTPPALAPALKNEYPEISLATRYTPYMGQSLVSYRDKKFNERIDFADPDFLQIFTFPFVKGDPRTALAEPYSVVITREMAEKYFGGEDPLGKVFQVDGKYDFKVTGVVKDIPQNSDIRFTFLSSFETLGALGFNITNWGNSLFTYVTLRKGVSDKAVSGKIRDRIQREIQVSTNPELFLFPFKKYHLYALSGHGGRIENVILFVIIAVFILLIACANFINLTTARAAKRFKEVAIEKIVGATRFHLTAKFFVESLLLAVIAAGFAILVVELTLPLFNELSGKTFTFTNVGDRLVFWVIGTALVAGLISGLYPALYVSGFHPLKALKPMSVETRWSFIPRRILVIFQFTISIMLIIATAIVFRQLQFMRDKKLGVDKENMVYFAVDSAIQDKIPEIKHELLQNNDIISVCGTSHIPIFVYSNGGGWRWEGKDPQQDELITFLGVDYDFLQTFHVKLNDGRFLSREFAADSKNSLVINQTFADLIGGQSVVGKSLFDGGNQRYTIIGVVNDFHFTRVQNKIGPLLIYLDSSPSYLFMKIRGANPASTFEYVDKVYKKFNTGYPLEYHFLDETYEQTFVTEKRLGKLSSSFAVLAIVISCLGVLGLAAFAAEQRTKEIGIRKVLGATVANVVALLSKDFVKLVLVANVIAWPVGWWAMNRWLQNFAYRIDISWWVFVLAGGLALLIALLTVSTQAIKAAVANPVESLRYE